MSWSNKIKCSSVIVPKVPDIPTENTFEYSEYTSDDDADDEYSSDNSSKYSEYSNTFSDFNDEHSLDDQFDYLDDNYCSVIQNKTSYPERITPLKYLPKDPELKYMDSMENASISNLTYDGKMKLTENNSKDKEFFQISKRKSFHDYLDFYYNNSHSKITQNKKRNCKEDSRATLQTALFANNEDDDNSYYDECEYCNEYYTSYHYCKESQYYSDDDYDIDYNYDDSWCDRYDSDDNIPDPYLRHLESNRYNHELTNMDYD